MTATLQATKPATADGEWVNWDLSDLYPSPDSPEIARDLDWARGEAERFHADFAGRLAALTSAEFAQAITTYEAITERLHRAMAYGQLYFAEDMGDAARGRFLQSLQESYNAISTETLFFTLELNRLYEETVERLLADSDAARYAPSVTGASAWVRLFDQTLAKLRCRIDGTELTLADTLNRFDSHDREVRRTAGKALGAALADRIDIFSLVVNTLAKDKEIEDRWRRYPNPISYRNLSNRVEDEVVDALVGAIKSAYDELAHRRLRPFPSEDGGP